MNYFDAWFLAYFVFYPRAPKPVNSVIRLVEPKTYFKLNFAWFLTWTRFIWFFKIIYITGEWSPKEGAFQNLQFEDLTQFE